VPDVTFTLGSPDMGRTTAIGQSRTAHPQPPRRKPDLESLRRTVRDLERGTGAGGPVLPLGADALDGVLPDGGLARAAVHEVQPARAVWDDGPAAAFAALVLGRAQANARGPVLWIAARQDLHVPGLAAFGLDRDRLLLARAGGDTDALWALEEALRCSALAGAAAEVSAFDQVGARRLQLAAEQGGVPGVLLQRRRMPAQGRQDPSAAATRWRVGAVPGAEGDVSGLPGRPRWRLELLRNRGGPPGDFEVEWDDATGDFALAAPVRHGTPGGAGEPVALGG
jgi:protein ImuA